MRDINLLHWHQLAHQSAQKKRRCLMSTVILVFLFLTLHGVLVHAGHLAGQQLSDLQNRLSLYETLHSVDQDNLNGDVIHQMHVSEKLFEKTVNGIMCLDENHVHVTDLHFQNHEMDLDGRIVNTTDLSNMLPVCFNQKNHLSVKKIRFSRQKEPNLFRFSLIII